MGIRAPFPPLDGRGRPRCLNLVDIAVQLDLAQGGAISGTLREGMENLDHLKALGLFDRRVPRYTSYPTAPVFTARTGAAFHEDRLGALDPDIPVSVYVHIPFCERLCWFCACRTQGTRTLGPVERYIEALEGELALMRNLLPAGLRMGRLHWGGGTPTILPPQLIHRLAQAIKAVIPPADPFEFSVEIDPTMVDQAKVEALSHEGMNRASIGIQDFSPDVQAAIGREQSFAATTACVRALRAAGIASINTDLVYGLPHQDLPRIEASMDKVLTLNPDRVALFGYAHVPHVAKRQVLIDEAHLPGDAERRALATTAARMLTGAGYGPIGIDHFAKPGDGLSRARVNGTLRRNFQGYTEDGCQTLLGIGASSISRFAEGYVQNAGATAAYAKRIEAGTLASHRGHRHTAEDRLRARVIEMLMCDFSVDLAALRSQFGAAADALGTVHADVAQRFAPYVSHSGDTLSIAPEGRAITRIIASAYDTRSPKDAVFSRAS
ncbi:MAG: oxygen-independent coproporphyrinogen-3 oxidase [Paracoccaceae bacterium]|jgi:oxygen-independent coproporphyrinogen-3 oxidase